MVIVLHCHHPVKGGVGWRGGVERRVLQSWTCIYRSMVIVLHCHHQVGVGGQEMDYNAIRCHRQIDSVLLNGQRSEPP